MTAAPALFPAPLPELLGGERVTYGEVFTRRWVVEMILDQCGYSPDQDLTPLTVVEPAVGNGAFLGPVIERLVQSRVTHAPDLDWEDLAGCVIGRDLQTGHVAACRALAIGVLTDAGCALPTATALADQWLNVGDFLLDDLEDLRADLVVGNPPYIRIEDLEPALLTTYRRACPTMGGRADVFIGFYERGLDVLKPGGKLGYICADRWMRNQYGQRLREKILSGGFAVDVCVVMHDVDAFADDVSAYPAVTVLRRGPQADVVVADTTSAFNAETARRFTQWSATTAPVLSTRGLQATRLPHWHKNPESWPDASPETIAWLERLDDTLPLLEDSRGTRISIGVATGADTVYLTHDQLLVEDERLLKLAMPTDIKSGTFTWSGTYLVNPWDPDGLVDMDDWPRFAAYMRRNESSLRRRSIGRRNPQRWHRTIDRVTRSLTDRPKLLLEDLKRQPNPVLESGGHYPHHNLYYIVSNDWDLEVLGGLLLSEVVERQIAAYCVKMRGKTLRFQAQYLRRVRVPKAAALADHVAENLTIAFRARDRAAATRAALEAYQMDRLPR